MADTTVTARFRADTSDVKTKLDALQKQFEETQNKLNNAGEKMSAAGRKLTLGVTTPLVGIGVAAAKTAMDFETSMSKIVGLVGLSTDEVDGMRDSVLALSGATAKAPEELSDALFVVTSAGLRGNDAMNALESAAKASTAGLGETADIARSVAGAMNAYGPATLDAAKATDVIVATARAGNFETSQFASAIGRVLPFAKQAGSSIEDMGGAVALLTRTNGDAAQSVTQVAALFRSFVVPTEEAKKALDGVGLSAADMREAISEQGLPAALTMLDEKLGGNREQLGRLLGSSEAASAAFQILDADADTIAGTFGTVSDSVGMTDDAFGAAADTAGFKMQQAMTDLKVALIEIGDVLLPVISTFAEFASGVLSRFNNLNPVIKNTVVIFGGIAAALGPVLWVGGKVMGMIAVMQFRWAVLKVKVTAATRMIGLRAKTMAAEIQLSMRTSQTSMGAMGAAAKVMGVKVIGAFRTIGVAAKGLVASLGPIGIAIGALSLGMEIFMGQSARAQGVAGELREEIDKVTGAFTDAGVAAIAFKLRQMIYPDEIAGLEEYGISVADMAAAIAEGGSAVDDLKGRMDDFRNRSLNPLTRFQSSNTVASFLEVATGADIARKSIEDEALAADDAGVSANDLAGALDGTGLSAQELGGDFNNLDQEIRDANDALKNINDMFSEFDANVAAIRAQDELRSYYRDINEEIAKNNRSLTKNGEAAMKNREAVLDALNLAKQDAQAWGEANNATLAQVEERFQGNVETLKRTLVDEGFTEAEIEKFFGSDYVDAAGVSVQEQIKGRIGTMADQLGREALREFKGVGRNMGEGLAAGVRASYTTVEGETTIMINRAEAAARRAAQTGSPSKVFMRIGGDLMDGLTIGISESNTEEWVERFATDLTDRMATAIESGEETILQAARGSFVDWYKEVEAELDANLQDAQDKFDSFAEGVSSSLMRGIDLGGAYDAQFGEAGARGGVSLLEGFRNQVRQVEWAGNVYQAVRDQAMRGGATAEAAQALTMALAAEGPAIGGALGQQLIDEGLAATMATEYQSVIDATRAVGVALMPEHLANGLMHAQAEYDGWTQRMGPGGDLRQNFLQEWRRVGVETSQKDYEGMRDALKKGGPVGDAIMNLFGRVGDRSATRTGRAFGQQVGGAVGNQMRADMESLARSLDRESYITIKTRYEGAETSYGGPPAGGGQQTVSWNFPTREIGGPVAARMPYIVGEKGPELFVPNMSGQIISNRDISRSSAGGGGGGSTTINVNVNAGMGTDGAEVGRQVVEAIRKYERRSGPVFASA